MKIGDFINRLDQYNPNKEIGLSVFDGDSLTKIMNLKEIDLIFDEEKDALFIHIDTDFEEGD